jgi:HlyD family secretion protein
MGRLIRFLAVLVVLALVGVGGYAWIQGRDAEQPPFETVAVERGDIVEKAVAIGQIEPRIEFEVKSKIAGIVERTYVDVGDVVAPGDPLIKIAPDPTPTELVEAERALESTASAYRRAETEWQRQQRLAGEGIVTQDAAEASREVFEQARIQWERRRDALELVREGRIEGRGRSMESIIRAPAAGIVLSRSIDPGDPVVPLTSYQEGTELATIADMSDLIFRGTVDEIDVGKLRVGYPARLSIGALPEATVTGILTRIAPQAIEQENAKLFEIEVELDPAPGLELRAGYSANADVIIREANGVLVIPERLVSFDDSDDELHAFVEVPPELPEGEPQRLPVRTGLSDGLRIEVVEGLSEGDAVVERPPRDILG